MGFWVWHFCQSISTSCVRAVYIPPHPSWQSSHRLLSPTLLYIKFVFLSMTLYIPTITAPFEPNCLHPKAPFEFLDDHTSETKAIGIDIGRNETDSTGVVGGSGDPGKINSAIHTYCVMSQVGVAAGVIVIIFTFLSILLLLLLSYQATDYLIERRALELLQHHALPSMVQSGIAPISNAYQTLASAIPPLRSTLPDEENNIHNMNNMSGSGMSMHGYRDVQLPDDRITPLHGHNFNGMNGHRGDVGVDVGMGIGPGRPPPVQQLQLQGWVTGGFEVDRR
ncbi:hypothetical protein ABW21_db0200160 [Orbilia brochopaga]|nr:hypothetical protein ABW21_db0200160 [Drechslerella brochopaga]